MTATTDDPWLVDAMWRAVDLRVAYLSQDRARVVTYLAGLDDTRLERVLAWMSVHHDEIFEQLGEPSLTVREIETVAALAPAEVELAVTTAVRRVAAGKTGLARTVSELAPLDSIHALAICTVVMLLEAVGRTGALESLDAETAEFRRVGQPRPYPIP